MHQTIDIINKTDYFDVERSRLVNRIPRLNTFASESNKRCAYEQRLWYEVQDVNSKCGQCFFYTLTYNDVALPHYLGIPCFSYDDIRDMTNGAFSKYIERHYGYEVRYFVSCESGEGAGKRGIGKNPHYHVIFFLTPIEKEMYRSERYIYAYYKRGLKKGQPKYKKRKVRLVCKPIDPKEFRRLVRRYWQGKDYEDYSKDQINKHNKNLLKYGIVEEGDNCGEILNFRACSYCAKYVVKDLGARSADKQVFHAIDDMLYNSFEPDLERFFYYCMSVGITDDTTLSTIVNDYVLHCDFFANRSDLSYLDKDYIWELLSSEDKTDFLEWYRYMHYNNFRVWCRAQYDEDLKELLIEYNNTHSARVRVSHGVGKCMTEQVIEKNDKLYVKMPTKDGFKFQPISNYTYRQLFYEHHIDPVTHNVYYALNEKGKEWKKKVICSQISSMAERIEKSLSLYKTEDYYNQMYKHYVDRNKNGLLDEDFPKLLTYNGFMKELKKVRNKHEMVYKYSLYKLLYENRLYFDDPRKNHVYFTDIDYDDDFAKFLDNTHHTTEYHPFGRSFLDSAITEHYKSFAYHPYFRGELQLYNCIDFLADYQTNAMDCKLRQDFEERIRLKKFHQKLK